MSPFTFLQSHLANISCGPVPRYQDQICGYSAVAASLLMTKVYFSANTELFPRACPRTLIILPPKRVYHLISFLSWFKYSLINNIIIIGVLLSGKHNMEQYYRSRLSFTLRKTLEHFRTTIKQLSTSRYFWNIVYIIQHCSSFRTFISFST